MMLTSGLSFPISTSVLEHAVDGELDEAPPLGSGIERSGSRDEDGSDRARPGTWLDEHAVAEVALALLLRRSGGTIVPID